MTEILIFLGGVFVGFIAGIALTAAGIMAQMAMGDIVSPGQSKQPEPGPSPTETPADTYTDSQRPKRARTMWDGIIPPKGGSGTAPPKKGV